MNMQIRAGLIGRNIGASRTPRLHQQEARAQAIDQRYDLLVTPTMPIPAFQAGHDFPPHVAHKQWSDWTPFTYPFNLTRQPAISLPCGLTSTGLPIGLQITGRRFDDLGVLRLARAWERLRPPLPAYPGAGA